MFRFFIYLTSVAKDGVMGTYPDFDLGNGIKKVENHCFKGRSPPSFRVPLRVLSKFLKNANVDPSEFIVLFDKIF